MPPPLIPTAQTVQRAFKYIKMLSVIGAALLWTNIAATQTCPSYSDYSQQPHAPYSSGRYALPFQRPTESCRTFKSQPVEDAITKYKGIIKDPDLYRLFENAFPNTLDTAVKWKGTAANSDEELAFLITGDINAMWLRDSANQVQSYKPLLVASSAADSLASLFRGVINLQSRYVLASPYCNSFQAPSESGIAPDSGSTANVTPTYNKNVVYECKYELDSLAAFLQVSTDYAESTNDTAFFAKYNWANAVKMALDTADSMMFPTYAANGSVNTSPYIYIQSSTAGTEVLSNSGVGNPFQGGTGLVRSFFRPSDDATIYQGFIPANMQFARYLNTSSHIAKAINKPKLADRMLKMAQNITRAINECGIVNDPRWGRIYAYEVDAYGSRNLMDDANIPSLLSAPFIGYTTVDDPVYQATRKMVLSDGNPYFERGPVINAVGGPHEGLGTAWPMASIVRIFTSSDDEEIYTALKEIVSSTDHLGLIHESINTFNQSKWTRQW